MEQGNKKSVDEFFLEGIEHFNHRRFFDAHEAWEWAWRGAASGERAFYKGLVHVAVCLVHAQRNNRHGVEALNRSAWRLLSTYMPSHRGIDLERLRASLPPGLATVLADLDRGASVDLSWTPIIERSSDPSCPKSHDDDGGRRHVRFQ